MTDTTFSFGIKYKIVGSTGKFAYKKVRLEHTEDGHNKFYELEVNMDRTPIDPYMVKSKYGKIGFIQGYDKNRFSSTEKANAFFEKKLREKMKKGYKIVSTS